MADNILCWVQVSNPFVHDDRFAVRVDDPLNELRLVTTADEWALLRKVSVPLRLCACVRVCVWGGVISVVRLCSRATSLNQTPPARGRALRATRSRGRASS